MPDADDISAILGLIEQLVRIIGPDRAVTLLIAGAVLILIYWLISNWRRDAGYREALKEKDRAIARIANQERAWRIYFAMKDQGLSQEQAERLFLHNEGDVPRDLRRLLRGPE